MEKPEEQAHKREFGLSSLSVDNSTSVFILIFIIVIMGLLSYTGMPKQQFPEIVLPTVYVNTIYPGNSPVDIENLITRHIEKELKTVKGVNKINSTSMQDVSVIMIEFSEDIEISKALQDSKDAVDKAKKDLPKDLDQDPLVQEVDFSEIPIMEINLSGDFEVSKLKEYAEELEDELESMTEVSKVIISGALDREIQINADIHKMDAMTVSFMDIENAVRGENITMAGGEILTNGFRRSLRIFAEFRSAKEIGDIVVKSEDQNTIYLKDIAEIKDSFVERQSYARLATGDFVQKGNFPVVSVRVIKKGGENLINADKKIRELLKKMKGTVFPPNLNLVLTNNQADDMKKQVENLENSIISGTILVVAVLLFFMGFRNSLFVGLAIPLSMLLAFIVLDMIGYTVNIMTLFSMILALGMLVDNAIVVVENTYRLMEKEKFGNIKAAKEGVGEVAIPIISSTLTTLAAFLPLAFWGGILGEFMKYLPVTLIIVLTASLLVGLIINPVMSAMFMRVDDGNPNRGRKFQLGFGFGFMGLAIPAYIFGSDYAWGNIFMTLGLLGVGNIYFMRPAARFFQDRILVWVENGYKKLINLALRGLNPYFILGGTFVLLILSIVIFSARQPLVLLFPDSDSPYVYIYLEAPLGTDVEQMNKLTKEAEQKVFKVLEPHQKIVKSIVTNIGLGTGNPMERSGDNVTPNKSKISVGFVDFELREGKSTNLILNELHDSMRGIAGLKVTMGKESGGPPVGKPVSIEVTGDDYLTLIKQAEKIKQTIDQAGIEGMEGLKIELDLGKPELLINIDRAKARRYGLSTSMLATTIRTALYGKEISKLKDKDEDHPIVVRLEDKYRYNLTTLFDQRLTFRDNKGKFHQIPISAIASLESSSSFGSVKRKDSDKLVVVSSGILEGYNPNQVVEQVKASLAGVEIENGYKYRFGGEQEEQAKSMAFLANALLIALASITLILVSQFNSIIKPFIIMCSVLFSTIGVFLGLAIFKMDFVIIMTGIGIISLAGVVVNNAIVLIDYTDLLKKRRQDELGLEADALLSPDDLRDCLALSGYTRLRPVLLTAITTVLGLVPLAIGLNIDFYGLYKTFNPNIFYGGENAAFWGPMAWTVIFGLTFATFLTLVVVPVMYFITEKIVMIGRKITGKA